MVLFEAIIVGITLIFIALFINKFLEPYLPPITQNKMIDGIFYTGLFTHLVFEYTGINLWYAQRKVISG
jgi:hypothetical protein